MEAEDSPKTGEVMKIPLLDPGQWIALVCVYSCLSDNVQLALGWLGEKPEV